MSKSLMYGLTTGGLILVTFLASLITSAESEIANPIQLSAQPKLEFSFDLSAQLKIRWKIENEELWIEVSKSSSGWAAVAFGKNMKKGDVLLIQKLPDDTSKLNVTNCFFRGYGSPNCTMSMQYTVVEQTSDDNSFSVLVRRPLTATDREKGMDINSYEADMVFAYTKNNKLESHTRPNVGGTFGAVQLNLMSGKKTGEKIGYKFGFLRHEYAQAIIWTLPVDLLILLARYFKGVPAWADIHLYVFMFLYAVSYISLDTHQGRIGPINPEYSTEMKSISKVHKNYYFVLIGFAAMQMIGGILLRIGRSTKSFSFQAKLKNGHIVGGILTWLTSRGFVLAGSLMFKSKFNDPFLLNAVIAETFLFFVAVGYLEMSRRKSFDEVPVIESSKDLSAYSLTLEDSEKVTDQVMVSMLKHRLTPAQLRARYPDLTVFVFLNRVYNLTGFSHPGGQAIFRQANWTEVSRYLFGISGLTGDSADAWKHSASAFKTLDSRAIGSLFVPQLTDADWPLHDDLHKPRFVADHFRLLQKDRLSATTSRFRLHCDGVHVRNDLLGTHWLGKHYVLSKTPQCKKRRMYTHCASVAGEMQTYEERLAAHTQDLLAGRDSHQHQDLSSLFPVRLDYLPLVIKKYESADGLSSTIHGLQPNESVHVEGPVGRGFLLDGVTGHVLLVAGGTGILPFADLLSLLFRKAVYTALHAKGLSTRSVFPPQDYTALFAGCRFTLLCSFRTLDDFVNVDTVRRLVQVCASAGLDLFRCVARVDGQDSQSLGLETTDQHFDSALLRRVYGSGDEIREVLVCGPGPMQNKVVKAAREFGVGDDRITLV